MGTIAGWATVSVVPRTDTEGGAETAAAVTGSTALAVSSRLLPLELVAGASGMIGAEGATPDGLLAVSLGRDGGLATVRPAICWDAAGGAASLEELCSRASACSRATAEPGWTLLEEGLGHA
jgi:hypothetical protein